MALSDAFLQELREKAEIEDIISSYVSLRRRGKTFSGICPFHNEKTPSFTVYPETQSFYCFGCGKGGDVITFIRQIENLDYMEAVKTVAERVGLNVPVQNEHDQAYAGLRRRVYEANREAARFYYGVLHSPEGAECLEYFRSRGVSEKMLTRFGLGCAPQSWDALLKHLTAQGFKPDELVAANLVRSSNRNNRTSYYDNFRNRVMFPIMDLRGNVIAFGGRVLDDSKPKYVNTSDTPVYKKSQGLFALNLAKNGNERKLILAEGYMDVIALHQAGFTNAVAGLGTALTKEQAGIISRYADEVTLSYDADEAGQEATRKAITILSQTGVKIKVLRLRGGKDPDEIIRKHGKERFRSLLDGAANDIEFKLLAQREKFDTETSDGKLGFLKAAAGVLASCGALERDIYATTLANELGVSKTSIISLAAEIAKKNAKARERSELRTAQKHIDETDKDVNPQRRKLLRAAKAEEILLATVMNNPDFLKSIEQKIKPADFVTDFNRRVFEVLSERISSGKGTELTYLSGEFSPDEMGAVARILSLGSTVSNTVRECDDCIKVISEEKNKAYAVNPAQLGDEEFRRLFEKQGNQ
ncbi:MAG: DNA primase [Clostridiales bacterium]|jgi:DNA primase|nr:DNA primase [Clostridiales bacterium]